MVSRWYPIDKIDEMYASHFDWLLLVREKLQRTTRRLDGAASSPLKKMKTNHSLVDGDESEEVDSGYRKYICWCWVCDVTRFLSSFEKGD